MASKLTAADTQLWSSASTSPVAAGTTSLVLSADQLPEGISMLSLICVPVLAGPAFKRLAMLLAVIEEMHCCCQAAADDCRAAEKAASDVQDWPGSCCAAGLCWVLMEVSSAAKA
jgi:hypothetical protein